MMRVLFDGFSSAAGIVGKAVDRPAVNAQAAGRRRIRQ
jgi:hypothetical protein